MRALEERGGAVEPPAPAAIEARLMPWAASFPVVSWTIAVFVGLAVFYLGLVMGGIVPWLALPLTIGGGLFAAFAAWRVLRAWRKRRADAPVVVIGPAGFYDSRIGPAIPWREIDALSVDQPGTRTFLRIAARDPARFARRRRVKRRAAREGVLISCLSELDRTPAALIAAAEDFRAATGR